MEGSPSAGVDAGDCDSLTEVGVGVGVSESLQGQSVADGVSVAEESVAVGISLLVRVSEGVGVELK